jgi:hypothetical protein
MESLYVVENEEFAGTTTDNNTKGTATLELRRMSDSGLSPIYFLRKKLATLVSIHQSVIFSAPPADITSMEAAIALPLVSDPQLADSVRHQHFRPAQ